MSDTSIVILSSTVVATIFSSVISIFINKKNGNLQYITSERKEWRKEIRLLAEEIYSSDLTNINETLVKLKVRINCYGKYMKNYKKDWHIWEVINNLENCKSDDELKHNKMILINYISLLLKADWERSKDEVIGNNLAILKGVLYFSTIVYYLYYFYFFYPTITEGNLIMMITYITLSLFAFPKLVFKILSKYDKYQDIFLYIYFMIIFAFFVFTSSMLLEFDINSDEKTVHMRFITLTILFFIVLGVTYFDINLKLTKSNSYNRAIQCEKKLSKQPINNEVE